MLLIMYIDIAGGLYESVKLFNIAQARREYWRFLNAWLDRLIRLRVNRLSQIKPTQSQQHLARPRMAYCYLFG